MYKLIIDIVNHYDYMCINCIRSHRLMHRLHHREEGIIPYQPELPTPFEALINYNQSVFNIRGVHTSPAGLESTSLVFAYGLG